MKNSFVTCRMKSGLKLFEQYFFMVITALYNTNADFNEVLTTCAKFEIAVSFLVRGCCLLANFDSFGWRDVKLVCVIRTWTETETIRK